MRIFKNKWFVRFARQQEIGDGDLCETVERAERGLVDADLGGGVIKQRIARSGEGRSGGFRSIILFRLGERAFFVYGFPKSNRGNIRPDERKGFQELAEVMLLFTDEQLQAALDAQALSEVICDEQDVQE